MVIYVNFTVAKCVIGDEYVAGLINGVLCSQIYIFFPRYRTSYSSRMLNCRHR